MTVKVCLCCTSQDSDIRVAYTGQKTSRLRLTIPSIRRGPRCPSNSGLQYILLCNQGQALQSQRLPGAGRPVGDEPHGVLLLPDPDLFRGIFQMFAL